MALATLLPLSDALVQAPRTDLPSGQQDSGAYHMTEPFVKYFGQFGEQLANAPQRVQTVSAASQSGAIATSTLNQGVTAAGLFRITYYEIITVPASVSSSLQVTFSWTTNGVAQTLSETAITGNTTTTFQSGTLTVYADGNTPITYSAAYGSVGTAMSYSLYITLEALST